MDVKLAIALLLCAGLGAAAAGASGGEEAKPDLTGVWVLNADASQELVRKKKTGEGLGGLRSSVSVGGIGIPLPGGGQAAATSGTKLKDPDVLFCQQLEISVVDEVVVVSYQGLGEDRMKPGKHQGKKVRPAFPFDPLDVHKLQVRLVDEGRRVQRVIWPFLAKTRPSELAELIVEKRNELIECSWVTLV